MTTSNKHAFTFGLISTFIAAIGFGIISPVLPFLVKSYTSSSSQQALMVTSLTAIYALFQFLMTPTLGALSDRFGRKPVLLLCLLGSAVGYFLFGFGGALWILFLGRIIDGITGGNIATILAYFADITPADERTKYFGWVSAIVGTGTVLGPSLGGFLAHFGNSVPLYFGAALSLVNFIYGYFFMPESLSNDKRAGQISILQLNPITQLLGVFTMKNLRPLLTTGFLIWFASSGLQGIFSQFLLSNFAWSAVLIGLAFSILGVMDIVAQTFIMPHLIKRFSDQFIIKLGLCFEIAGYLLMAIAAIAHQPILIVAALFLYGFGDSIFGPAFNGAVSKAATESEQGRVQGASQSLRAFTLIAGPLVAGLLYNLTSSLPMIFGAMLLIIALLTATKKSRQI